MKNLLLFLLLNFLAYNHIVAQNQSKIDSLSKVLVTTKMDTVRIRTLLSIGRQYQNAKPDTALFYYKKALSLSKKSKKERCEAKASNRLGYFYYKQSDYQKALEYYHKSLHIEEELGNKKKIATILNSIGNVYYRQSNLEKALEYYFKSLHIKEELGNKNGIAASSSNIGNVYYIQSDLKKALEYYLKSLHIEEELENKNGIAASSTNIGNVYSVQSDYVKALEYYTKALYINTKQGNKKGVVSNLTTIGKIYWHQGDNDKSLEFMLKALQLNKELGDKSGIARIHLDIAGVYWIRADYDKALKNMFKALEVNKELGNKGSIGMNLLSIGVFYKEKNDYEKSMEYYMESLKIARETKNNYLIGMCLSNIGNIYFLQNNYNKSLEYHLKEIEISKGRLDKRATAIDLISIGSDYRKLNNSDLALKYYLESLKISQEIGIKNNIALNYNNIGNIYLDKGDNDIALKNYIRALNIYKKTKYKSQLTSSLTNIGNVYYIQSKNDTALEYANKSLNLATEINSINREVSAYDLLSKIYSSQHQTTKAADCYNELININNKNILMNFSFIPEYAKQLYFTAKEPYYWRYNSFVLQNRDRFPTMIETVYNNTLKNKGLLLKSNTAMRNAINTSNDTTLIELYDNWIMLKRQIAKKYSKGEVATKQENKADSLESVLVKKSNEFSDFNKVQNISWKDIKSNLKTNEIAIEFTQFPIFNDNTNVINKIQYVALIVTSNSRYPEMIPLFKEDQLEKIIGKFGGNNYSYINDIYGKKSEVNIELYNLIWAPIDNYLYNNDSTSKQSTHKLRIFISPSGLLHKISFSAIAKGQDIYLCDAYNLEMKSTTGKITVNNTQATSTNGITTATLFGGINYDTDSTLYQGWSYLDGTQSETEKINKILKKGRVKVNYFTNTNATEEEFKLIAYHSEIIHIATHGFFYPDPNDIQQKIDTIEIVNQIVFRGGSRGFGVNSFVNNNNPLMRSGLVFAGANDVWNKKTKNDTIDDGVLTAQEVANIDMRKTKLVVMSACETGLGDIKGSEGVYGLQRAFKMAGVNYMIMSLWQVPDKETEEFMTTFYKKLIKTKDIKQSFAETQKDMRLKYDPYFWAAFVLIE
jgi:tetratricopeptide (TPR) repeat protein